MVVEDVEELVMCTFNHLEWALIINGNIFLEKGHNNQYAHMTRVCLANPKGVMELLVVSSDLFDRFLHTLTAPDLPRPPHVSPCQ